MEMKYESPIIVSRRNRGQANRRGESEKEAKKREKEEKQRERERKRKERKKEKKRKKKRKEEKKERKKGASYIWLALHAPRYFTILPTFRKRVSRSSRSSEIARAARAQGERKALIL